MIETAMNESYLKYREEQSYLKPYQYMKLIRTRLDEWLYDDESEYLERSDIPFEKRLYLVESLSRLSDITGYHQLVLREVRKLLEFHGKIDGKPLRFLDIGSGGGGMLRTLYRWAQKNTISVELFGVDYSEGFAREIQSRLNAKGIPVQIYHGDASELDFLEADSFDYVLSNYMVHHLRSAGRVARFLAHVYRIAGKGWVIADFERYVWAPAFMKMITTVLGTPRELVEDGVKSIRRSYRHHEIQFIIDEACKRQMLGLMRCTQYGLFPYWFISGRK